MLALIDFWEAKSGPLVLGDLDCDAQLTLNDAVLELNWVFLGDSFTAPAVAGEVNCDAVFTSADVVWLLNRAFLQIAFPCSLSCNDPFFGDTCKIRPLKKDEDAAWSPDGQAIAYFHAGNTGLGDTSGIYLIDTSGTNKRLFIPSVLAVHPAFSPDGQWLAFANLADNSISKIKLNGDNLTRLTFNGDKDQSPAWSPDGEWLLYVRLFGSEAERGLRLMDKNGQNDRKLLFATGEPNWSIDGLHILCRSAILEQGQYKPYIAVFSLVDSTLKKLRLVDGDWHYFRWSPDNSQILMTVTEENNPCYSGGTFLYVMDSTGQTFQKLLTTLSWEGAWSPDGNRIVYTDSRPGLGILFIMDADGSNKKQLTFKPK